MFERAILEGARLRLIELHHAELLFDAVDSNRDHLRRWLPWVDGTKSVDDCRAFIRRALDQFAHGHGFHAGIWAGSRYAGTIGHHRIDWANRSVSLGYWLAADFQGRGLMTAACRLFVTHAFGELRLHRIEIRCAVGNLKSCAIPERLGFTQEALLRAGHTVGGAAHDEVIYGLLAEDPRPDGPAGG